MKKRTIWTRMLCMTLALAMCLSLVPTAFASETTEGQVMVGTETGSTEQIDVTITIDAVQQPGNISEEASAAPVIAATEAVAPEQAAAPVPSDAAPPPGNTAAMETTTGQVHVETEAGSTEKVDVTVTVDQTQNSDGTTTTQTTTEAKDFVTEKDLVVDYNGSSTTVTDPDGEVIQSNTDTEYNVSNQEGTQGATGGSETSLEQVAPKVEVDVPLTDTDDPDTEEVENQNTQASDLFAGTVTEVTGDVKENEEDGEYDYTTGTVEKPGSTTVTTTDVTITETYFFGTLVELHTILAVVEREIRVAPFEEYHSIDEACEDEVETYAAYHDDEALPCGL